MLSPCVRRRLQASLLLLLAVGWAAVAAAPTDAPQISLDHQVRQARRVARRVAVHVVDVASGETVYEHDADHSLVPASNQKLVTSAAALDRLGPGYQFETPVVYQGVLHRGILVGDVGVVAGGDPNLSARFFDEDHALFRHWSQQLKAAGVDRITGRLLLALGRFDPSAVHPDWPEDQLDRCYEAPVTGLDYSDNCLVVRVWPGARPGQPPLVELSPPDFYGELRNRAVTRAKGPMRLRLDWNERDAVLELSGYIASGRLERFLAVRDPTRFFAQALRHALDEAGIVLEGPTELVLDLPKGLWRTLTVHRSDLLTAIEVSNKHSHNFSAESLFKTLGAEFCSSGSWAGGQTVVGDFLTSVVGWQPGSFTVADGSGMSRQNRLTARQLTTLLRFMASHPHGRVFARSLPASGELGASLEERFLEPPLRGNVFAKTGTLTGVSTLSGYAKGASGRLYAFSILMNRASVWRSRKAQDEIVTALVEGG